MSDNKAEPTTQQLLATVLPTDDIEEMRLVAEENAVEIESGELDPIEALGMRGMGLDAEGVEGAIDIGAQMLRQGMNQQAFQYFMGMVQFEPLNWRVYQLLGLSQHRLKHYPVAAQCYTLALSLSENEPLTTLYLGECEWMLGQHESGLARVKQALEALRKDPENKAYCKRAEQILAMQSATSTTSPPATEK
jgi:tetratricopeptide (TPR) repeat protein